MKLTVAFNNLEVSLGFSNFGKSSVMRIREENESLIGLDFRENRRVEDSSIENLFKDFHCKWENNNICNSRWGKWVKRNACVCVFINNNTFVY